MLIWTRVRFGQKLTSQDFFVWLFIGLSVASASLLSVSLYNVVYYCLNVSVGPEMSTLINVNHELREKLEASSLFIKMHEAMGRDYRENYEKSIEENSVFEILTVENLSLVSITFLAGWANTLGKNNGTSSYSSNNLFVNYDSKLSKDCQTYLANLVGCIVYWISAMD